MNKRTKRSGMGIITALTLVFVLLKVLHVVDWPWLWVLSPIWISAIFAAVLFSAILIGGKMKKGSW